MAWKDWRDLLAGLRHELDLKRQKDLGGQRGGRREQMENMQRTWCHVHTNVCLCACVCVCVRYVCWEKFSKQIGTNLTPEAV